MGRVQRLPEEVANQIAAGEVVERPASVVKELVENALDAEATRVEVEVSGGGVGLIAVTDDGLGMSRDDAVLALERHATSKIRSAADLNVVKSLGFRGEALPSIASVSRFSLSTRARGESEGTVVRVEGGLLHQVAAAAAAPGTRVEVRDLFFNVPARRKFLKSAATEQSHISEALVRLALARPGLHVRLSSEGRVVLDVAAESAADPRGRLGRLLGREVAARLYPIVQASGAVEVSGWASAPDLSERTPRSLYLFVNGRFVRDRTAQHAIQEAYRTLLERGRHPVVLLFLSLDPERVDVNVHPQKTEVRFRESGEIHRAVTQALRRTLEPQPWLAEGERQGAEAGARRYRLEPGGFEQHAARMQGALRSLGRDPGGWAADRPRGERSAEWRPLPAAVEEEVPSEPPGQEASEGEGQVQPLRPELGWSGSQGLFGSLEPVGQVMATYLVCQGQGRMVIIDQHAAHERIAFERLRKQVRARQVASQPLLVPLSIELDPARAQVAAESGARLLDLGLELEPFGGSTWMVKSRPAALPGASLERMVLDLLDELKEVGTTTPMEEALDALCSCAACHTVVRAGDRLSLGEIKALLQQMDEIDFGAHCPHGRPVFAEWSERQLKALFHRS